MGDVSAIILAADQATGEGGGSNFLLPNGTFFVVLIIFLIVLGVIGTFVVPPIMKVLGDRENMVAKTLADNKMSAEQFAAAEADYEEAMSHARVKASGVRDDARAQGRKVLEDMRARAEEQAGSTLQSAGEQLKREGDVVAANLRARVETMSATLASRILGVDITRSTAATAASKR
jgi:F-type H+-transporting ATPase subunit b